MLWLATKRARRRRQVSHGFRFYRRIKVLPGIKLNVSKSGVSTSVGVKGAHVTIGGPRGTRATAGLPGTGVSYTEVTSPGITSRYRPPLSA
jgi:hypothetical protein